MSELPALFTGQASTESRTVVSQSPDPTSVEFESVFRDLLDEALKPENRKLLIVVDNLDRVEPSDALSIWSTLQTFLGHKEYQRPDWIDRLWILIPYDDNAILRLWDGSGPNANSKLATSFLDKTFQLRFRVPHSCFQTGASSSKRLFSKRFRITGKRIIMAFSVPLLPRAGPICLHPLLATSRPLSTK